MKRDMDLVREILLQVESHNSPDEELENLKVEGFDDLLIFYHVHLLSDAGLLWATEARAIGIYEWSPIALTWAGHEFLDSIRDPEIWEKTKNSARSAGGFTMDLLKDIAKGFFKKKIEEHTGVSL